MIEIVKYDLEGNFLEVIKEENLNLIATKEKVDYTSLKRNSQGITLSVGNFQYRIIDHNVNTPVKIGAVWHLINGKYTKKVGVIGKYYQGKLVCTYESLTEIAKKNNFDDITNMSRQLKKNKSISKGGFTFKKLN